MRAGVALALVLLLIFSLPWLVNFYKLTQCDFESNYKCELIHGAGVLVPPISLATMWVGIDE